MELVLSLVLAHLVADFMLQTGKSCKDKKERHWKSPHHYVHALIVFGLSWLVSWDVCFWWGALMIGVAHLGIDIWKSYREDNVVWFTLDQVLHLLVIAGVAYAWTRCHDWSEMLIIVHVTELITHNSGVANRGVDIRMRVTINPDVNSTVSNIVAQFCGEGSV